MPQPVLHDSEGFVQDESQTRHVPKRSDDSARAWIEGKLLTVLLIERLLDEASFFSPWGFEIKAAQSLEGIPGSP